MSPLLQRLPIASRCLQSFTESACAMILSWCATQSRTLGSTRSDSAETSAHPASARNHRRRHHGQR